MTALKLQILTIFHWATNVKLDLIEIYGKEKMQNAKYNRIQTKTQLTVTWGT